MTYDRAQVATYYAGLCAARTDAYSQWTGDQWVAVRRPLTPEVVLGAFESKVPVSGYMIGADSTTHVMALDIDLEDGWEVARRIGAAMWADDAPAYIERSRRGAHLWAFLDQRVPAIVARRAWRSYVAAARVTLDPKIELRPGSDRIDPDGLGHALRMPTMPHQVTGKRDALRDPRSGEPIGAGLAQILLAIEIVPAARISAAAERYQPPIDPRSLPSRYRRPKPIDEDGPSVVELLAEMGVAARPGRAVRCPFHDDKRPSLSIADDERRVFCKSPECEAHNLGRGLGTHQLTALIRRRAG